MMGRQATKRELFVSVSLDEYVPEDHLLRAVDRYLDLSEFRANLAESYSHTGRPSIDPELMARMLSAKTRHQTSDELSEHSLDYALNLSCTVTSSGLLLPGSFSPQ
jgi:transposase